MVWICACDSPAAPPPAADVHRHREHDRRRRLARDLDQRLVEPQLQRPRVRGDHLGRLRQLRRRLDLALGRDHLGAPLALGLGLPRHRPLHLLGQLDVLDLDRRDLDAPLLGARVQDAAHLAVDRVAVARGSRPGPSCPAPRAASSTPAATSPAGSPPPRSMAWLRRRDRRVDDRVDADRDVVVRDDLLRRDLDRARARVDHPHAVDAERQQQVQPRAPPAPCGPARTGTRPPARTPATPAPP